MGNFLERAEELRDMWENNYQIRVRENVQVVQTRSLDFIQQLKAVL